MEEFLRTEVIGLTSNDRNNIKFHLAMYTVYRLAKRVNAQATAITNLPLSDLTDDLLRDTYEDVSAVFKRIQDKDNLSYDQIAKGREAVAQLLTELSDKKPYESARPKRV